MKLISLTKGYSTCVDDDDYTYLMQWKWCAFVNRSDIVYAVRGVKKNGKTKLVYMHREITGAKKELVDHIDHDGLNNQKENLRLANHKQNAAHSRKQKNRGEVRGVRKHRGKYSARITIDQCDIHIGVFNTIEEAARAYDAVAIKAFGEFAKPNFL